MDIVWVDPLGDIEAGSENMDDPFYVSVQRYVQGTKAYVTVGHLPREVCRHIQVAGRKLGYRNQRPKLHRSIVALKGLEIPLEVKYVMSCSRRNLA